LSIKRGHEPEPGSGAVNVSTQQASRIESWLRPVFAGPKNPVPIRQNGMLQTIQRNAARIRELHAAIHETVKHRANSPEEWKVWQETCRQFHSSYDSLAFPGGLNQGIQRIKNGDVESIETALIYLENPPYCFRSQYVATDLKRALNKASLPEPFCSRFSQWKDRKKFQITPFGKTR
jgi:hypothetical protein